jgi:hypothetical protein
LGKAILTNVTIEWFLSGVNAGMSLQVLFFKQCHLTICQIENNFLKSFVPANVSRQLTSHIEYLPTARLNALYISQKHINSIHIGNKCNHVGVCNVVILEKMYPVNIKEVTYYVSLFHFPCSSHTSLFHSLI